MINVNNTAINIATGLDRVKLRVEFFNSNEQSELIIALKSLLSDGIAPADLFGQPAGVIRTVLK